MKNIKKILVMFVALAFMCTPVFAGDQPEYDVVGCDATNFLNDFAMNLVCNKNIKTPDKINEYSDFTDDCDLPVLMNMDGITRSLCDEVYGAECFWEYFETNANMLGPDPCFPGYNSHLATAFNSYFFEWQIVLQKKPQTDLDISIRDCVLKFNSFTLFGTNPLEGAEQTGRISMFGMPGSFWLLNANPRISVIALPGPNAPEFCSGCIFTPSPPFGPKCPGGWFWMDARSLPGLEPVGMDDVLYTSKGLWEESIVLRMPETGDPSMVGGRCNIQTRLRSGDRLRIHVEFTEENTANVNYGKDNISVKYVAIHGTEFLDTENNNNMDEGNTYCGECPPL